MHSVIVTGGSRGLGLGIAQLLCAEGYQVIAVARGESEPLAAAIAENDAKSGAIHFRACDLADTAAIPDFVKSVARISAPFMVL